MGNVARGKITTAKKVSSCKCNASICFAQPSDVGHCLTEVLMTLSKTEIKLCDFGSAMDVGEAVKTAYLQPRFYRAPEVILGTGHLDSSYAVVWRVICHHVRFYDHVWSSIILVWWFVQCIMQLLLVLQLTCFWHFQGDSLSRLLLTG